MKNLQAPIVYGGLTAKPKRAHFRRAVGARLLSWRLQAATFPADAWERGLRADGAKRPGTTGETGHGIGINVASQTDTVPPPIVTSTSVLLA
jgi:hypothetical protein